MAVFLTLNMSGIYSCLRFEWLIQLFVPKCLLNCPHWSYWIIKSSPPTELRCNLYHKLNSHIYLDIFLNLHFSPYDWSLYLCTSTLFGLPQWWRICLLMEETPIQSLGWEDPLEEEMATYSSILAWEIPWTEELGGL